MAKNKNKTTLDTLAQMVAKGFEVAATKEELKELGKRTDLKFLKIEMDMGDLKQGLSRVNDRVDEIHEILARFEEGDILDLQKRVKILERAVKALGRQLS